MDWLAFGGKLAGTIAAKMALNAALPGTGAAVDVAQAVYDFSQGNVAGGLINLVSGVGEVCTFGITGCVKDLMKGSAKKVGVQTIKEMAKKVEKEATKKVGRELGKRLAKGMIEEGGKEAAIKAAKVAAHETAKKATKKLGQQFSEKIAKGLFNEVVEELWIGSTKMTVTKFAHGVSINFISAGGREVIGTVKKGLYHDLTKAGFEAFLSEMTKQTQKTSVCALTQSATSAASKELMKNAWKFTGIDYTVAVAKGGIKLFQRIAALEVK